MKMEAVSEKLNLPKDLLLGAAIVTLTGQNEAYIENHRGIIEYTDKLLKIQTKTCKILITGTALTIKYYTNEEIKLNGQISEVKYY